MRGASRMEFLSIVAASILAVSILASGLAGTCVAQAAAGGADASATAPKVVFPDPKTRSPAFKGTWNGPTKLVLPGPGPKPGQSIAEYFASLPLSDRHPVQHRVLVLGGTHGFHHDSVPAAMNMVYAAGRSSGLWQTEFATDFALVNPRGGGPMRAGFQPEGLKDFDAVVVASATGDWQLSAEQKRALLAFVHEEGRGLVVIHGGIDANHDWREYLDMVGAEFVGHPFNTSQQVLVPFAIVNESPSFPIVRHLPGAFVKQDEIYIVRNWSRGELNVLLSLDAAKLDYDLYPDIQTQLPPDRDFPVAWTRRYGKGRVFASSLGHAAEAFEDPEIVSLYTEGVKWVLRLTDGEDAPHGRQR